VFFQDKPKSTVWEKYKPWFFVRLNDGKLSEAYGQIWRRWNGETWEYCQDEETEDDFDARQY